jgi:hypothetical protein
MQLIAFAAHPNLSQDKNDRRKMDCSESKKFTKLIDHNARRCQPPLPYESPCQPLHEIV